MSRVIKGLVMAASSLATLSISATVFAHVVVNPAQSTVGTEQTYTMRVPCEKTIPTTKIVLKIPSGTEYDSYEPVTGWTVTTQKTGNSEVVTWQANGSGIQPGQFEEFPFIAANSKTPTALNWDAYQYYKDGSIVEWTGAPGSATPHSITQVVSATQAASTPASSSSSQTASTPGFSLNWTTADTWVLTVSIIAILMSGLAIGLAVRSGNKE